MSSGPGIWYTSSGPTFISRMQEFEGVVRDPRLDLEPHHPAEAPSCELRLDGGEQVVGLLFLHLEVGVAGYPEGVMVDDLHPGNNASRCAAITCSSDTKRSPSGITTNRGRIGAP